MRDTPQNSRRVVYMRLIPSRVAARGDLHQSHMQRREKRSDGKITQTSRDATKARTHGFRGAEIIASSTGWPRFTWMHRWQKCSGQRLPLGLTPWHMNLIPWNLVPSAGDIVPAHQVHSSARPSCAFVHVFLSCRTARHSAHATTPGSSCARGTSGTVDQRPHSRRPEAGQNARLTGWLPQSAWTFFRLAWFGISCGAFRSRYRGAAR